MRARPGESYERMGSHFQVAGEGEGLWRIGKSRDIGRGPTGSDRASHSTSAVPPSISGSIIVAWEAIR